MARSWPGKFPRALGEFAPLPNSDATRSRFARSADVCNGMGFGDAGGETARETENLSAWGDESGRGPARGAGIRREEAISFVKKRLNLDVLLYTLLQIFSLTLYRESPIE